MPGDLREAAAGARRLLIIRLSSIGDVVHALPVSAAFGETFPHLSISWIVEEMSAEIVTGNPFVRDVIVIPRSRWKSGRFRSPRVWVEYAAFLKRLRSSRFDITIDLQGYGKSGLMALATGAPCRVGWWRLKEGAQIVSRAIPKARSSVHRVEWFLDCAAALGADTSCPRFPLHIPDTATLRARQLLQEAGIDSDQRFVVLNCATGSAARRWGAIHYAQLAAGFADGFGLRSVLVGSAKDKKVNSRVAALAETMLVGRCAAMRPLDLAGQTSLKELAAVLQASSLHIGGDTGSMHIAAALGTPVVGIYGPTDPAHAGPWGQLDRVLERRTLCANECGVRRCVRTTDAQLVSRVGVVEEPASPRAHDEPTAVCLAAIPASEVLRKAGEVLYATER
ncbi:MAG TPA: glycosyltransferase family 9 protein [Chthonomonadales bacterium]|nr:glycosyltransferase family 9 protein [Chthonomonadales bacterium]